MRVKSYTQRSLLYYNIYSLTGTAEVRVPAAGRAHQRRRAAAALVRAAAGRRGEVGGGINIIYMCGILRNCKFCDSLGRKYVVHSTKAYGLTDRLKNTVDRLTEVRIQVSTESP